jgi:multiple sugar transport system substrate-binding protein
MDNISIPKMSRRSLLKAAGATAAAAPLASLPAWLGASPALADQPASGNLTILTEAATDVQQTAEQVLQLFAKIAPNVHVKHQTMAGGGLTGGWGQYIDGVTTMIAGGTPPDVVWMATEGLRPFSSHALLQPLNDYIARDKADLSDYMADIPSVFFDKWDPLVAPDGSHYYLPGPFNTVCMWCNLELFQKAGLDEPQDNWTWDDFLKAAKTITDKLKVYGYHADTAYFYGVMPWLLTNGASSLSPDWSKATIDTPAAIEAASFASALVTQNISPRPGGQFDPYAALAQGKLGMFAAGWWPHVNMTQMNFTDKVKIVTFPKKTQLASPVGWTLYPMFKASQNKEAAWALIKFIASKEVNEVFAQGGPALPIRRSVALSEAVLKQGPKGTARLYEALDYSSPIPAPSSLALIQPDIEDTWSQILLGNVTPKQGLSDLNDRIQSNLSS